MRAKSSQNPNLTQLFQNFCACACSNLDFQTKHVSVLFISMCVTPDSGIWNTFDFSTERKQLLHAGNKIMGCSFHLFTAKGVSVCVYLFVFVCLLWMHLSLTLVSSHLYSMDIELAVKGVHLCARCWLYNSTRVPLWMCVDPLWVGGRGANTVIKFAHTYLHADTIFLFEIFCYSSINNRNVSFTFLSFACDHSSSTVCGKLDK